MFARRNSSRLRLNFLLGLSRDDWCAMVLITVVLGISWYIPIGDVIPLDRRSRNLHGSFWNICEIRKAMNVELHLLRVERSQLRSFGHVTKMSQERSERKVLLAIHTQENCPQVDKWSGGVSTSPALIGSVLVRSQQN